MRESTKWFLHIISGAIIIVVLGIHFCIMHFDDLLWYLGIGFKDTLSFAAVSYRSKMLFHLIVYLILLGTALYHGFYGLRSILFELSLGTRLEKIVSIGITIIGVLLFIYGAQAIIIGYLS